MHPNSSSDLVELPLPAQDRLEHDVARLSAIALGAQALADRREAAGGTTDVDQVALARLHWAVDAARRRLDGLVGGDADSADLS